MTKSLKLLAFCSFLILVGHGYQYLFFDAPWRVLAWDQKLLEPIITGVFRTPWAVYAAKLEVSQYIRSVSYWTGVGMIFSGFTSLLLIKHPRGWLTFPIYISSFLLFIHTYLEMRDQFNHLGHLVEYSVQIFTPIALVLFLRKKINQKQLEVGLKILVIATFFAHGLYAVGFYPIPGNFVDMIILSFGVSEDTAKMILRIVGVLDIILVPLIFFKPLAKWALWYAIFWGMATAIARVWANFHASFLWDSLHQYVYQMLVRLPHGLVPLVLWWMYKNKPVKSNRNKLPV